MHMNEFFDKCMATRTRNVVIAVIHDVNYESRGAKTITTVEQFVAWVSRQCLKYTPNCGKKTIMDIEYILDSLGYKLKDRLDGEG